MYIFIRHCKHLDMIYYESGNRSMKSIESFQCRGVDLESVSVDKGWRRQNEKFESIHPILQHCLYAREPCSYFKPCISATNI